jgi:hypothetical protein
VLDLDLVCELGRRCGLDQALRFLPLEDPVVLERLVAVDEDNQEWLRRLVEERGWPGRSLVGEHSAQNAWLLAQHACDLDFQLRCRDLVEAAVAAGEATSMQLAYLDDRVRVRQGRGQRYGTQVRYDDSGRPEPAELDDPGGVDGRRHEVGLGPLADYLAGFEPVAPGDR